MVLTEIFCDLSIQFAIDDVPLGLDFCKNDIYRLAELFAVDRHININPCDCRSILCSPLPANVVKPIFYGFLIGTSLDFEDFPGDGSITNVFEIFFQAFLPKLDPFFICHILVLVFTQPIQTGSDHIRMHIGNKTIDITGKGSIDVRRYDLPH